MAKRKLEKRKNPETAEKEQKYEDDKFWSKA
jgi:hypothetical protein